MKKLVHIGLAVLMSLSCGLDAYSQCRLLREKTFLPQNKKIKLVARSGDTSDSSKVIFFNPQIKNF